MLSAFLLFMLNAIKSSLSCLRQAGKSAKRLFFMRVCAFLCKNVLLHFLMVPNVPVMHILKLHAVPTLIDCQKHI